MNLSRIFLQALLIAVLSVPAYTQHDGAQPSFQLRPLTALEEIELMSVPELRLPSGFANRDLPAVVDNSANIHMRPAYQQDGLSCGQASMIGYNFTYEMARIRNLNASQVQNQYPSHFSWNFMNGGEGWYGVSYLHSVQILKEFGMPNVVDYGGTMGYGGGSRWLSGYDPYYNGMHNRINNVYQIQVGTPEGLMVLKNWLHNHLENSDIGGLACFYAQHMSATNTLPAGTPEAGKYVLTYFGGSPNHSMTIVGYNDSIRWDYNNDGQYTNHLDINNDGVVNMKDWEIGGFKMVQSYGGVPNWGNQGYAYMMYKTVADNLGSGGIWNHCVHVLDVKETCDPKLTARITLKHTRRERIKVLVGLSNNTASSVPEITLGFPIYDYQGGNRYMQGGTSEADKTIEFGLDLSKLLSFVNLNQNVKIFLQVVEKDPGNSYSGDIIHYSIYDHTAGGNQIVCPQSNVPLVNDDTTTLSVTHLFNFNRVHVVDESLPPAPQGQYYSHQLTAGGGTPPFTWEFDKKYTETSQTANFPMINAVQLSPSNNSSGKVTQTIGFSFPFFDTAFNSITVYVDGYLMFDQQLYPYPYFYDDKVLFNVTRNISPFMNQHQEISYSAGGGIWYEGDANSATFRWKTRATENPSWEFNYAVKLFPDGTIKFYYGSMTGCGEYLWISGISDGDNYNQQFTAISNKPTVTPNSVITLQRYDYPPEMELSEDGLFSGTPQQSYGSEQITFKVTDNNFIHSTKTFIFSSSGIMVQDSIVAGGNTIIAFNETADMTVKITNLRSESINNATMKIWINDPYFTVTDSTQYLGTLVPGVLQRYPNAFQFQVSPDVPDNYLFTIETVITSGTDTWESDLFHYAYAPVISRESVVVNDDNGRLDPGDVTDMTVNFMNTGGVEVYNLFTILSTTDPYVTINQSFGIIPLLQPGQVAGVIYNISVSGSCPPGHEIEFLVTMTGDNNFNATDTLTMPVGLSREDFESGDFSLFSWGSSGHRPWSIDTFSPQEGNFCAKSGPIHHNEESILRIDLDVLVAGEISFYKRVICENDTSVNNNYDYLSFRIDGAEQQRWDGESAWSWHAFPVSAGFHRFEWVYHKDQSVHYQMDAAWVDNIVLPSANIVTPVLAAEPQAVDVSMKPGESETVQLLLTNAAPGSLDFKVLVSGREPGNMAATAGRNIEGSKLVTDAGAFHIEKEYTWNFRAYNGGNDNEWVKEIYISFPDGINLTTASDFIGGSGGTMFFQGPLGNGVTAHWFGEDPNGWGVIKMGENASSEVIVNTTASILEDPMIHYEVLGEVYGSPPHVVAGSFHLRNLGPETTWLTLDTHAGTIAGNGTVALNMNISSEGLDDGMYYSWIILEDNFGHEVVVPVTLLVDTFLGMDKPVSAGSALTLEALPNPFRDRTFIKIQMARPEMYRLDILNSMGVFIRSEMMEAADGFNFAWDGKDGSGNSLPPGVYLIRVIAGQNIGFLKLILAK